MAKTPYKLRIRRVRENVVVDMLVPLGRGKYSVVESHNCGPVSMRQAVESLATADLSKSPRLAAAVVPEIT